MSDFDTAMYGSAFPGKDAEFRISNHSDSHPYSVCFGSLSIHLTETQARTLSMMLRDEIVRRDAIASAEYELIAGLRDAYDTPYEVA